MAWDSKNHINSSPQAQTGVIKLKFLNILKCMYKIIACNPIKLTLIPNIPSNHIPPPLPTESQTRVMAF